MARPTMDSSDSSHSKTVQLSNGPFQSLHVSTQLGYSLNSNNFLRYNRNTSQRWMSTTHFLLCPKLAPWARHVHKKSPKIAPWARQVYRKIQCFKNQAQHSIKKVIDSRFNYQTYCHIVIELVISKIYSLYFIKTKNNYKKNFKYV